MNEWLGQIPAAGLVFARCAGVLAIAPPLNVREFPFALRAGLAASLAVVLAPIAPPAAEIAQVAPVAYLALLIQEAALGLAAGLAGALVYWGFLIAGQLLDRTLDAGQASHRTRGRGPFGTLVYLLAAAALLAADGHHWLLAALARGMRVIPPGRAWGAVDLAGLIDAAGVMLWTGVAIAAPILAAIYAAEVALAAFGRVAPGLGLTDAAPAVRWTSGLLGLIVTLPLLWRVVADQGLRAARAVEAAFRMLGG